MTITPAFLYRLSAGAVVAAFVLNLTGGLLHPVVDGNSHSVDSLTAWSSPWAQLILLVGTVVQLAALPGIYAWIAPRVGVGGLVAFVTLYASLMLTALPHLAVEAFVSYELASDPGTAHLVPADGSLFPSTTFTAIQTMFGLAYMLSLIVLGVVLARSSAVPRWIGIVMAIGGLICVVPWPEAPGVTGLVIELPRGLAFAAIGVLILRAGGEHVRSAAAERSARPLPV
ncbi:hypothetical protein [Rhodococcus gannanensis]|uniref:DUF4386 domain-containing protein n=1 Tax=Rhodococcus gannanensis TaxID=1960308 RepID=A0ABW4P6P5_9NOCA